MKPKVGFDNKKYLKQQTSEILKRIKKYNNKLYLEFGGKLIFDYHAARVLPGYDPNVKMRLLQKLKDKTDIILCIYAGDIEKKKVRADFGITYDAEALKLIDDVKAWGLSICAVVITRFEGQPAARMFKNKLERRGIKVYTHGFTKGYPTDVELVVSGKGYGANAYIPTKKPLVVITGPGPGSGKLATCLSQYYHDHKRGKKSGYSKFETFPIWNLGVKHPVNIAYEAATAEMGDFNLVDPFHLEATGKTSVNYNRDVDAFPLLHRIMEKIAGPKAAYVSPTDMGVNQAGFGIVNDKVVREAARQEVIRRFFRYSCEYMIGLVDKASVERIELLMTELGVSQTDRPVVSPARKAAAAAEKKKKSGVSIYCGAALCLPDGTIVTGKNSCQMHAASALIINAVKQLAKIPDRIHLIAPSVMESVANLKEDVLNSRGINLDLDETLIALAISAITNPTVQEAVGCLKELRGCEMHMTHIPTPGDEAGLRKLGVNLTSDANFSSKNLFIS